jgi:phosphinothricin acetyltransferase
MMIVTDDCRGGGFRETMGCLGEPPAALWRQATPSHGTRMASDLSCTIRRAELADVPAITDIYNEAILTTTATFDIEPKSVADRRSWFQSHDERHPVLVAVVDGKVVGWASLTRWSDRRAYDDSAETSSFVSSQHRGRGIGRRLKEAIIEEARRMGFHTLVARVAEVSRESFHLNESCGFVHVGTLKEVGRKFERLLSVHIQQKMLV